MAETALVACAVAWWTVIGGPWWFPASFVLIAAVHVVFVRYGSSLGERGQNVIAAAILWPLFGAIYVLPFVILGLLTWWIAPLLR